MTEKPSPGPRCPRGVQSSRPWDTSPPGYQASLGLALTALLMRQTNQKTTKQTFTNLLPPKSSAPTLSYDFAGKSPALQLFSLFWPQTQRVICCFPCEVGPAEMGFFYIWWSISRAPHSLNAQYTSWTKKTTHFSPFTLDFHFSFRH